MKKIFFNFAVTILTISAFAGAVHAQDKIQNPLGNSNADLYTFIVSVLGVVTKLGAVVVVMAIIYVGFLYVTARGNEEQVSKAHSALTWTVVGAAILLGAQVLAEVIKNTITQLGSGIN